MKTFQIAVVDDLSTDRARLSNALEAYMAEEHLAHTLVPYRSGEAFVAALESGLRFDIVFMDVYMDGMTGVEAAAKLRTIDRDCKLVFLTTSEEYMREGFALNSAHYLIKPVNAEDLRQAMENCRVHRLVDVPMLTVTSGRQLLEVDTFGLYYINVESRNVTLHTETGELTAGRNFSAVVEPILPDARFLMCNKALLVNMDHITGIEDDSFRLTNGELLPIAQRRRQELTAQYRNYVFGHMGGI